MFLGILYTWRKFCEILPQIYKRKNGVGYKILLNSTKFTILHPPFCLFHGDYTKYYNREYKKQQSIFCTK